MGLKLDTLPSELSRQLAQHAGPNHIGKASKTVTCIRESVDSLCRDDTDTPMSPYRCNLPNAAYLSLLRI